MNRFRRWTKIILVLLLMAALASAVSADGETGITLGSGAVTTGNQVYFGNYNGEYYKGPVLWQVMGNGNAGSGMLLLSEYLLGATQFNPVNADANEWQKSIAQGWCGTFYSDSFSASEKLAVIQTSKTDAAYDGSYDSSSLNGEYVFFLSAEEAETYFPKGNDNSRKAYFEDISSPYYWWLRSPHAIISNNAGIVDDDGWVSAYIVYEYNGARPAFNLDLSKVIIASGSGPYKLSMLDKDLKVSLQSGKTPTMQGSTVTIPYSISGQNAGNATRLLVLITNNSFDPESAGWGSGAVIQKSTIKSTPGTSGTVSLDLGDLSTEKWGTDYHVYLIAEDENDGNLTNYASEPYEIQKPTPPAKPTFSPSAGSFIGAQSVTISCETADAEIRYTTDGTTPTATTGIQYSGPISISQTTTTIKAIAVKNGSSSDAAEATYTITAPTYTLTVTAPTFTDVKYGYAQPAAQEITITSSGNSDAAITGVSLTGEGASAFTLNKTDGTTIAHGTTDNTTYKIQPAAGLDADTYTATITVTYNGGATDTAEVSLTVNRAENPLKVIRPLPAIVLRGGHTADLKSYINISEAAGTITYEVTYPTDHPASGCSVDDKGVFKSGNTTGGSVVKVTAAGNRNYYASNYVSDFPVVITVEVMEKPVADLSVTQKGAISGETLQDPKYTVPEGTIDGTLTVSYSGTTTAGVSYGPSPEKPAEPGSYTVTVSCETMDTVYSSGAVAFEIEEATHVLTVGAPSFDAVTYGYDQQPDAGGITFKNEGNSDAVITGVSLTGEGASAFTLNKTDGMTIAHGKTDNTTYKIQPAAGLAAGTYTAVITVESNDGQKTANVSFTVDRKAVTVTALNKNKYEGEDDPELEAKVEGLLGEDTVIYSLSREPGEAADDYTITAAGEELQGNYKVSFIDGTFTIYAKGSPRFIEDKEPQGAVDLVADGEHPLQLLKVEGQTNDGIVMYSMNGGRTWSSDIPTASKPGRYEILYYIMGDGTHTNSAEFGPIVVVIADQPMDVTVDFVFVQHDGSRGVPFDIKEGTLSPVLTLKQGDEEVSQSESVDVEIRAKATEASQTVRFSVLLDDLGPGKYAVVVSGLPKEMEKEVPDAANKPKYQLTAKAEINNRGGITVYLIWDDGNRPEEPVVYPLPEDEIGAYWLRKDGTKEYLLFHTYDICMAWLGREELCKGPERCFHKDGK